MSSVFEQVGVYFNDRVKNWWSQKCAEHKIKKKIKVFAALIKENTIVSPENPDYRFQIIVFGIGTKYENKCVSKEDNVHLCDGHAESLCYYAAHVYFQTQLKKWKLTGEKCPLFYSTEDGYMLKPQYKFLLLVSRPPCGFLSNDSKHLLSWKIPFEEQPHIPECSSRILIDSYLGIQGPLTILLTKPIYIADVIILEYDELNKRNFTVFNNMKKIETYLENIETTLATRNKKLKAPNIFSFHKPNIITHQVKSEELDKIFDGCDFTLDKKNTSRSCFVHIPMEINEVQKVLTTLTGIFKQDKEEKRNYTQELWKEIAKTFVIDSKLNANHFICRIENISEALKILSLALDINVSIDKAKVELGNCTKHSEQNMEEIARYKRMLNSLDKLIFKEGQFFDCAWNKYQLLMQNALDEYHKLHS